MSLSRLWEIISILRHEIDHIHVSRYIRANINDCHSVDKEKDETGYPTSNIVFMP
jgi:hypothetical protein